MKLTPLAILVCALSLSACGDPKPVAGPGPRAPDAEGHPATAPAPAPIAIAGAERVRFASRDEDLTNGAPTMLDGVLFKPAGAGPFPAVIALHGCGGLFAADGHLSPRDSEWANRLRDLGYVVLLPDSFNPRGVPAICKLTGRTIRAAYERTRDAYGALVHLQTLPFVRPDRIALLGWSNGAITTLYAVNQSAHARPKTLAHDFQVAIAFYPGCEKVFEQEKWATKIPLEIMIGGADDWTLAAPCTSLTERAHAAGQPVNIQVFPGAFHDFDAPSMPIHQLTGIATTSSGKATVGTNPAARDEAIRRVPEILASHLPQ